MLDHSEPAIKMQRPALGDNLAHLKDVSGFVTRSPTMPNKRQPYVGDAAAFVHKGAYIHAVPKNAATYEHIDPAVVGNRRRISSSDYAGSGL